MDILHIGMQGLALFLNESAVWTNQLNGWFSDKISYLPPPNGSLSVIFKVLFQLFKSYFYSIINQYFYIQIVYLKH